VLKVNDVGGIWLQAGCLESCNWLSYGPGGEAEGKEKENSSGSRKGPV
jgi:hypothetical protein